MTIGLEQIALIGIVIALVIDRVLAMLKDRGIDLRRMGEKVDDLYEMHDVKVNGHYVWYVRKELYEDVKELLRKLDKIYTEIKLIEQRMDYMNQGNRRNPGDEK